MVPPPWRAGDLAGQPVRLRPAAVVVAILLLVFRAAAAPSDPTERPARPSGPEWLDQTFPSIPRHTRYEVVSVSPRPGRAARPAFLAHSDCSASGKILPLEGVDLDPTPFLHWSWKIVRGLDVASERTAAGDDFAARVYVLFAFDSDRASLSDRIAHRLSASLRGEAVPGGALNYVFASRVAAGSSWRNPSQSRARMIALRTGSLAAAKPLESSEGWHHETVDVQADRARLFSSDVSRTIVALALMTDSDDTCTSATALYSDFCFTRERGDDCSAPGALRGEVADRVVERAR